MNIEYKDFIGVFSEVYPEGFCEHLIAEFKHNKSLGASKDRQQTDGALPHIKNDNQLGAHLTENKLLNFREKDAKELFFSGLQQCFDEYTKEYSWLSTITLNCTQMKMQETVSGGGYHVWHGEQGNGDQATRGLVYMLYLNTLPPEANGETEFLYQQRRINPVGNTMVIWPAAFTHLHRGNPVYGDNIKYIVTGWFCHE